MVSVRMWTRAAVIRRSEWGWRIMSKMLYTELLARGISSCLAFDRKPQFFWHMDLFMGHLSVLMTWMLTSIRENNKGKRESHCAFRLSLQSHPYGHFHFILFVRSESLCLACTQKGKKLDSNSWREKYQRICGHILKPPQVYFKSLQRPLANCSCLCCYSGLNSVPPKFVSTWNLRT